MNPADLAATLEPYLASKRWFIAYSGGVDSHVLLHAVAGLRASMARESITLPPLAAIHINHQLNPRASDWVEHCRSICAQLAVEFIVETVQVPGDTGLGLEAAARSARYAAFEKNLAADDLLLQAHHRDDQIETLFMRLLRGAGLAGLASIPKLRVLGKGRLLRPLLLVTRAEIIDYAQQNRLRWIHDDSNDNESFDRNFLRLRVLPLLTERWPGYRDTLQRVIGNAVEADGLLKELAALDYTDAIVLDQALRIDKCRQLSVARQRNLLFYWLRQRQLPQPSREQLAHVLAMFDARDDAQPCATWPGAEIRRFRGDLYALNPLPDVPQDFDNLWHPPQPLIIDGAGTLQASKEIGTGLRIDRSYRVRNRRGGERCQPCGRAHSQILKKLLQEYDVPPWKRDRLPLIYSGDEIAAVADLWVCEGFQAAPNTSGWRIEWRSEV